MHRETVIKLVTKKLYLIARLNKPYVPTPHPMQHRIDEFRAIPSLVTGGVR
jgi:hypothetical protein